VQRFARDVGINVLANIIAAAIIYLLGVWVGAFPTIGELVYASAAIVIFGLGLLSVALVVRAHRQGSVRIRAIGLLVSAVGAAIAAASGAYRNFTEGDFTDFTEADFSWAVVGTVGGIVALLASAILARRLFRQVARERAAISHDEWSPNPRAYL
jgi:hypothetical protein